MMEWEDLHGAVERKHKMVIFVSILPGIGSSDKNGNSFGLSTRWDDIVFLFPLKLIG